MNQHTELAAALRDLVDALRNRHYGRMPEEVQRAYDNALAALAQPAQEPSFLMLIEGPDWRARYDTAKRAFIDPVPAARPAQDGGEVLTVEQALRAVLRLIRRNAPELSGKVIGDAEAALLAHAAAPQAAQLYPLPDSLYPDSKDWQAADYAGRVEWLHQMYEGKKMEVEELTAQPAQGGEALTALRQTLDGKASAAYCKYIETLRRTECLGWEHKVKTGTFGEAELKAHTLAAEYLGMHRAFSAALDDVLAAISQPKGGV